MHRPVRCWNNWKQDSGGDVAVVNTLEVDEVEVRSQSDVSGMEDN